MSQAEFRATGLDKLSATELAALDDWLVRFAQVVAQRSAAGAGSADVTPAVIESRIDGEFSGWDGETIFKLQNGQIWQQASYAYKYSYKFSPKVLIVQSEGGYKMQVDGVDGTIAVRRLK